MSSTRRVFVRRSAAAAGAFLVSPLACTRTNGSSAHSAADTAPGEEGHQPSYLQLERDGELARREEQLWEVLASCRCCPRHCGADRLAGDTGVCSSDDRLKLAAVAPHFGEEPPLVGDGGSGTVFFSNCNLLCVFCQNWQINHRGDGRFVSHQRLAQEMLALQESGCHNINLVTPTHVIPHVVRSLRLAIAGGLRLPLVYNTGGYDDLAMIELLDGIVDIYLPDFKYQDGEMAAKYSFEARDYPQVAAAAIQEMHSQVGRLQVDGRGVAARGLIMRHLVLPNNIAGTDRFVRWVADTLTADTYVNIMAQYRPEHRAAEFPQISRRLTREEWNQSVTWARDAGLVNLDRRSLTSGRLRLGG